MEKVLVANRGEIACRVIRSARELGFATVAVFSEADREAKHVELADEAVFIGPSRPAESYLSIDRIVSAAKAVRADAIHPGYGFLSENPDFARRVQGEGIVWVGPTPLTMVNMGDKDKARTLAAKAGVPVLPGSRRFSYGALERLEQEADVVGYPLLVKAASGGGGIGMRLVEAPESLRSVTVAMQALAERVFGDGTVFLERYVTHARHIEIQVFGFGDGRAIHLFERECSIQRRFQKIIEEAPAPNLPEEIRSAMTTAAVALTRQERYSGAGTVEFVLDVDRQEFYFLEMNTRIQVEHPVTEETTGFDIVAMQLRLALGLGGLIEDQVSVRQYGSAIEARLYAENPNKMFLPSPGTLEELRFPENQQGIRVETGIRSGDTVTTFYDPMIAKIIASADERGEALHRLENALLATTVEGISNNLEFLKECIRHPTFRAGEVDTGFVEWFGDQLLQAEGR